jgi:hypothetical protein
MATTEKKIHFYRISDGLPDSNGDAAPVDIIKMLNEIFEIETSPDTNFMDWKEDDKLGFWSHTRDFPYRVKLGKIRYKNLPQKNNGITLQELGLNINEGLVELTHAVFWDNGIVGMEYNHHGPRTSAFTDYFHQKTNNWVVFNSIYNQNADQLLADLQGIYEVKLRVKPSLMDQIALEQDLGVISGLSNIGENTDSDVIEINMKKYKKSEERFLSGNLVRWCQRLFATRSRAIETFKISGKSGGVDFRKDLLEDLFVFDKRVTKLDNSRGVDAEDMFNKIVEVYISNEDEILNSSVIEYVDSSND